MLKGVNKQIIEINNPDNLYFEKILFFIKPECGTVSQKKLEMGAELYLEQLRAPLEYHGACGYLRKRQRRTQLIFWAGGFCVIGVCALAIGLICLL